MFTKSQGIFLLLAFLILNIGVISYRYVHSMRINAILMNAIYMGEDYNPCTCKNFGYSEMHDSEVTVPSWQREDVYSVAEHLPHFPGCEDDEREQERIKCSNQKIKDFVRKNIKYPPINFKERKKGVVFVLAFVMRDGTICNIRILRGLGEFYDKEAIRLVRMMNNLNYKWMPGIQQGKQVGVVLHIPIRFELY